MSDTDPADDRPGRAGPTALERLLTDPGVRWLLLGAVALVTMVFGYVGFRAYFRGVGIDKSTTDLCT